MKARTTAALGLVALNALLPACVRRTIDITSEPSGALVMLNEREVGRTPLVVEFTYYGDYDVVLRLDGYEPLVTSGKASPPIWDNVPLDLFAEMIPADLRSEIKWHYVLEPAKSEGVIERAREMQQLAGSEDVPAVK